MKHGYFLDISSDTASDTSMPYVVLPIPYERTVSFGKGTELGPAAILNASHEVEDFDEELRVEPAFNVQTLPAPILNTESEALALKEIEEIAFPHMNNSKFLLSLGGEHTITAPLVEAARSCFTDISVLQLDAHLDLRDSYEDNPLSHACVMKRIRDKNIPTVHCGTRSCSAQEFKYAQASRIPIFWARDITSSQDEAWMDDAINELTDNVYLSVDIDVFDPSIVPGTGTPEPGGLDWHQVTGLIKRLIAKRNVIAADIVELAPQKGNSTSEFIAARLGAKIIAYHESKVLS